MDYKPVSYRLKSLEEMHEPEEFFSVGGRPTLENYHAWIDQYRLNDSVPIKIQELFETARNLQLYGWHVYRFGMVAAKQAIAAMEMALREKSIAEGYKLSGLRNLLEKAHKDNWVDLNKIEPTLSAENFIDSICGLRNDFAHGSSMLMEPAMFVSFLMSTAQVINQLHPK